MRKIVLAIIGGHECNGKTTRLTRQLGRKLAALKVKEHI